jgi:hypothetical protein
LGDGAAFLPSNIKPTQTGETAQRTEAVKLLDLLGMSLRLLAFIVGLVVAALVLWLARELVR